MIHIMCFSYSVVSNYYLIKGHGESFTCGGLILASTDQNSPQHV